MTQAGFGTAGPHTLTIPGALDQAVRTRGDQVAVVVPSGTELTYETLANRSSIFGAALVAAGIEQGDRVAIWAANCVEWIIAYFGLQLAGAALVPVNTRFRGIEAADILGRSRARALITATDFLGTDYIELLSRSGVDLPDLRSVIVASGDAPPGTEPWTVFLDRVDRRSDAELRRRRASVGPSDPADILFTSGTTGSPKGVRMSQTQTLAVASDWVEMTGLAAGDRYLMINPFFHMFGLKSGILASVLAGATMMPEPTLDVPRLLERVEREKVTVLPGPPTLYQSILDHPDRAGRNLSSLRLAVTGASDIPVELIRRITEELPFSTIISGYGLTEGGTLTGTKRSDSFETVAKTVGSPRPGFAIRIVTTAGGDAVPGEAGEIWAQGPSITSGYLDDPIATQAALTDDGWLRTGDLGVLGDDGNLRIVGRLKDMFIVGGFNAYPAEIENLLLRHAEVRQAAVVGVPDVRLGEVGAAYVVRASGSSLTPEELISWSRQEMANYKVPRTVVFVEELPLNATGKVQKDALRARAAQAD